MHFCEKIFLMVWQDQTGYGVASCLKISLMIIFTISLTHLSCTCTHTRTHTHARTHTRTHTHTHTHTNTDTHIHTGLVTTCPQMTHKQIHIHTDACPHRHTHNYTYYSYIITLLTYFLKCKLCLEYKSCDAMQVLSCVKWEENNSHVWVCNNHVIAILTTIMFTLVITSNTWLFHTVITHCYCHTDIVY